MLNIGPSSADEALVRMIQWSALRLLGALLLLLGLIVYLLLSHTGAFGTAGNRQHADAPQLARGCPTRGAPAVLRVPPSRLRRLRLDVHSPIRAQRARRLYERGTVTAENAWSDGNPTPGATLEPESERVPAGYEMRWWLGSGDDIASDVFVFATGRAAGEFFARASSRRCRADGRSKRAPSPRGARDLAWRNPDGVVENDVYLLRGMRVYRLADVRPDATATQSKRERDAAFSLVNAMACGFPRGGCEARARAHSPA